MEGGSVRCCIGVLLQICQRTGRRIAQPMTTLFAGQTLKLNFWAASTSSSVGDTLFLKLIRKKEPVI